MAGSSAVDVADRGDLIWAAGVFDARGTLHADRRADGRTAIRLHAPTRSEATALHLQSIFGGGALLGSAAGSGRGVLWEGRRQVPRIVAAVRPYLHAWPEVADELLRRYPWPIPPRTCLWQGCLEPARARGTCPRHFAAVNRGYQHYRDAVGPDVPDEDLLNKVDFWHSYLAMAAQDPDWHRHTSQGRILSVQRRMLARGSLEALRLLQAASSEL